jgi:hypothetical protein
MQRNTLMNHNRPLAQRWIKDIDPKNISFTLSRRIPQHDGSIYLTSAWFRNFTERKVALMLLQNHNSKRTLYAKAKLFSSI